MIPAPVLHGCRSFLFELTLAAASPCCGGFRASRSGLPHLVKSGFDPYSFNRRGDGPRLSFSF
jgi:hypothetical protein